MSSRVCLIIYDLPVYISSCLFSWMLSGRLVIPGVSCLWVLPCPVMSCLDVLIKYYHLSWYPRLRVPVPPSCVHRDTSTLFFAHLIVLHFLFHCTFYSYFSFVPYICSCVVLLLYNSYFLLFCTVHWADLIRLHLTSDYTLYNLLCDK